MGALLFFLLGSLLKHLVEFLAFTAFLDEVSHNVLRWAEGRKAFGGGRRQGLIHNREQEADNEKARILFLDLSLRSLSQRDASQRGDGIQKTAHLGLSKVSLAQNRAKGTQVLLGSGGEVRDRDRRQLRLELKGARRTPRRGDHEILLLLPWLHQI